MMAPVWVSGTEFVSARDAEVGDLHVAVGRDEDVAGLDVAVDHARVVRGLQTRAPPARSTSHGLRRDRAGSVAADQRGQRLARHVLHHQERAARRRPSWPALALAEVVARRRCWGATGWRCGAPPPGSARRKRRVVGVLAAQDLDGDLAAEHVVLAAPDLAHAAAGDALDRAGSGCRAPGRRRGLTARSTASMTARAIGAASSLPLTSGGAAAVLEHRPRPPPSASVSDGRERHEPGVGLAIAALLRGAGLAGDLDAVDRRRWCRCRRRRRPSSSAPASAAVCGLIDVLELAAAGRCRSPRGPGPATSCTRYGAISTPRFATRGARPAPSATASRGRRTGRWPTARSAARWGPRGTGWRRCASAPRRPR